MAQQMVPCQSEVLIPIANSSILVYLLIESEGLQLPIVILPSIDQLHNIVEASGHNLMGIRSQKPMHSLIAIRNGLRPNIVIEILGRAPDLEGESLSLVHSGGEIEVVDRISVPSIMNNEENGIDGNGFVSSLGVDLQLQIKGASIDLVLGGMMEGEVLGLEFLDLPVFAVVDGDAGVGVLEVEVGGVIGFLSVNQHLVVDLEGLVRPAMGSLLGLQPQVHG